MPRFLAPRLLLLAICLSGILLFPTNGSAGSTDRVAESADQVRTGAPRAPSGVRVVAMVGGVDGLTLLAFRGPGQYVSLLKLATCWLLFLLWVWTCDWVNRDSLNHRLNYSLWNSVMVFTFLGAILLLFSPLSMLFPIAVVLIVLAYLGSFVSYVMVRNNAVEEHEQVFTPDHLRHLLTGKEKLADHEKGAPVELTALGAATERENNANLLAARQHPGFVMVKDLVADLIKERGSAVMLDYEPESVAVRYQVDGIWHDNEPLDRESGDGMLAVIKILSGANQDERRQRQAGSFAAKLAKAKFNCELTSQGTKSGERALLKLNEGGRNFHTFEELGLREKHRNRFLELLAGDSGFLLFASMPAGGLTTTIDVGLEETDRLLRNFVAVESKSSREHEIENVEVTTYDKKKGETPATVLPQLVRTYPDVIVIRDLDEETLRIMCEQVGETRLVIGSIRAKGAADALLRVLALKDAASHFAPVISAVLYSRLIRRLCPTCKVSYEPPPEVLKKLGIPKGRVEFLYREPNPDEVDKVCAECGGIGYLGRTAMFEFLEADDAIRGLLAKRAKIDLIKKAARAAGMRSIQEEGILLVAKGVTSLPELMRVLKL